MAKILELFPLMFRIRGTVLLSIWFQVMLFAVYTAALVYAHNEIDDFDIKFPHLLIPILSGVIGLLLVFRTNTAYDRYYEGRRIWSTMTQNIRALTRSIWVMVEEKEEGPKDLVEKTCVINLLIAYPYAVKNYIRGEYSHKRENLRSLLQHIPKFSTVESSNLLSVNDNAQKGGSVRHRKQDSGSSDNDDSSAEAKSKPKKYIFQAYEQFVPTNIPIEISYAIASYMLSVKKRALLDPPTATLMTNSLNGLVDCLGGFERILRTPIPLAYSVHLHHVTWLYLCSLPFQLIGSLNWFAIPAVTLAAFALLGILRVGWEIENPFGYDDNDLPLDDACRVIHREILRIIRRPMPSADSWIWAQNNQPLAPDSTLTSVELTEMDEETVLRKLANVADGKLSQKYLNLSVADLRVASSASASRLDKIKEENQEMSAMISKA